MRTLWLKRVLSAGGLVAAIVALVWLVRPSSVPVDIATVTMGPMEVTVNDDGKTRVRHVYTVSAPVAGKVLRISRPSGDQALSRHVGDPVTAEETVVAIMQPVSPSFLDVRSREEIQATVAAADAAMNLASAEVRRIEAALAFARDELKRAQSLARTDVISVRGLDKAKLDVETNEAALASAKAQLEVRRNERASTAARLIDPASPASPGLADCCVRIRAPVTGRVLKVIQDSEAVVPAGTPLIDLGDPSDLEVVADLLSSDAVQIKVGAPVRIDGWGGSALKGRVVRVDPAGFLKVSALGIEEQRVRVTIDFADPREAWAQLGHDYRVIVHVAVWASDKTLTVPAGALFRSGDAWAVYSIKNGRARTTLVQVGHRNARIAEVVSGLAAGDRVVLHPSDRVKDGIAVAQRETR